MATMNFSASTRVWLEYTAFAVVPHTNNTGRFGDYTRAVTGWCQETWLKFDLTALPDYSTITAVTLTITCNTKGSQVLGTTLNLYDGAPFVNAPAIPEFDDVSWGAGAVPWAITLSTLPSTGTTTGTYVFPSTAPFVGRAQSVPENPAVNELFFAVGAGFGAVGAWLSLDSAVLNVTYDPQNITRNIYLDSDSEDIMDLREDTAHTLLVGPFVSDTDFKTTQTGLTLAGSDFRISKNGGTVSTPTLTSASHAYDGYYYCTFPVATFDTAGRLDLAVSKAGSLKFKQVHMVKTAAVYDALYTAAILDVNVSKVAGSTQTISTQAQVQQIIDKLPVGYMAGQTTLLQVQEDTQNIRSKMPAGTVMAQSDLASIASQSSVDGIVAKLPIGKIAEQSVLETVELTINSIDAVMPATVIATKANTDLLATQTSVTSIVNKLPTGNIADQNSIDDLDTEIDAITAKMPTTGQVADQASIEAILAVLPPDQIVGLGDLGAVTLDASTDNFDVVAHALKTYNATALSPVAGSIYQTIITPLSNIDSQLPAGGAEIASGVQVEETAQNTRYIMKNRMVKNNDGTITFYEDDNTTPAFSVSHTETERVPL